MGTGYVRWDGLVGWVGGATNYACMAGATRVMWSMNPTTVFIAASLYQHL